MVDTMEWLTATIMAPMRSFICTPIASSIERGLKRHVEGLT
jgi:hypothetical protein